MTTKPLETPKILFMHGLESFPGGGKDRYLRQNFAHVCTPEMHTSLFNLSRQNSVIRQILRRPLFRIWLVTTVVVLLWAVYSYGLLMSVVVLIVCAGLLLAIRNILVGQALVASFSRCVAIQREAIERAKPDVVLGSSWGGVVALLCVGRGFYRGPLLLLAPPLKLVFDKLGRVHCHEWKNLCTMLKEMSEKILVIHGEDDTVVPVDHSRLLAAETGVELMVIPGGDHQLSIFLGIDQASAMNERLKNILIEVAERQT